LLQIYFLSLQILLSNLLLLLFPKFLRLFFRNKHLYINIQSRLNLSYKIRVRKTPLPILLHIPISLLFPILQLRPTSIPITCIHITNSLLSNHIRIFESLRSSTLSRFFIQNSLISFSFIEVSSGYRLAIFNALAHPWISFLSIRTYILLFPVFSIFKKQLKLSLAS